MSESKASTWQMPDRVLVMGAAFVCSCLFIGLLRLSLGESHAGVVLLDSAAETFPFTIQNLMHIAFFLGLGELFVRWRTAAYERAFVSCGYLPEDDETVLQAEDLGDIRSRVHRAFDADRGFLPYLIDLCILQFQASRSVDQTVSVLNSSLELIAHRVDLRYSNLRYIVWAIPTFGFIGTVVGIASALRNIFAAPATAPASATPASAVADSILAQANAAAGAATDNVDLQAVTTELGLAFNTTLVALILSAILVFLLHVVQKQEEESVNLAGSYCLRNLINRLYAGGKI